jgi:hypothetical protein
MLRAMIYVDQNFSSFLFTLCPEFAKITPSNEWSSST